ncbi:hypothetical protein OESDEN_13974 [Oesophagostomum dentatum]|uniref:Uncharacterized protein n=1 Tax=Oesophagostomum dentatum TaxID=61180 RepID=A0A0B1SSV6_OESDE|nr:hypothetical protein OESDEN_13974 [Oesophagostomum dentatum]
MWSVDHVHSDYVDEFSEVQVKPGQVSGELESLEVQVVDARNILRSRFHYCTAHWQEEDTPHDQLRSGLVKEYWHQALHTARDLYPESLQCLMDMKPLLQKHKRLVQQLDQWRSEEEEKISAGLDAFLSKSQVKELRFLHERGDGDSVESAVCRVFLKSYLFFSASLFTLNITAN